jgi:hypothetical protein
MTTKRKSFETIDTVRLPTYGTPRQRIAYKIAVGRDGGVDTIESTGYVIRSHGLTLVLDVNDDGVPDRLCHYTTGRKLTDLHYTPRASLDDSIDAAREKAIEFLDALFSRVGVDRVRAVINSAEIIN